MKTYEEMARDVFRRMDAYEAEQRAKRAKFAKTAAAVTPVCAAAAVAVGLWQGGVLAQKPAELTVGSAAPAVSEQTQEPSANENSAALQTENAANSSEAKAARNTAPPAETAEAEPNAPAEDAQGEIPAEESAANASEAAPDADEKQPAQTALPAPQTEPVPQNDPAEQTAPDSGESGMLWCIVSSSLAWNGQIYHDSDTPNASAYTLDKYLGKVKDFEGTYSDSCQYRISPEDSVYTVMETTDVLFVVKADANYYRRVIVMCSPDWSLEKYEPERLDPNYVDPEALTLPPVTFNGFCQ